MTQTGYDDGDGRWDVSVKCDGCGQETWDPWLDDPMTWRCHIDPEDGPDYCPSCAKMRNLEPGWIMEP